jgi:phosphoglycerol transferase MdoB-like AlkP superfamily enzyme
MLPHEPFYLDSTGNYVSDTIIIRNTFDFKTGYLNQLKYANMLLKKIIAAISKNSKNKVVIMEGDHGYREYVGEGAKEKSFMNLNTYYFSDGDYSQLYDGISPVNSFRVVLNKYFCQSLPLLKDSSIDVVK